MPCARVIPTSLFINNLNARFVLSNYSNLIRDRRRIKITVCYWKSGFLLKNWEKMQSLATVTKQMLVRISFGNSEIKVIRKRLRKSWLKCLESLKQILWFRIGTHKPKMSWRTYSSKSIQQRLPVVERYLEKASKELNVRRKLWIQIWNTFSHKTFTENSLLPLAQWALYSTKSL